MTPQEPSGPPTMPTPAASGGGGGGGFRVTWKALVIALVVVLLVGAAVGGALVFSGGGDSSSKKEVFTEPISTARNPFSPPVGQDSPNVPPVEQAGSTTQVGGVPGLYGGTMQQGTCNKTQLVTFLQQNPDKGAPWASTLGITPDQIATYVQKLTPVILRSDTRLTNHGFKNGNATSFQTVLQAGTAVLVDEKGEVVTKCYCGNPLTPPVSYPQTYSGSKWTGFSSSNLTVIVQNTTIIQTFTLIDINTRQPFQRPAGTDGTRDTPGTGAPGPPPSSLPPGTSTPPPTRAGPDAQYQAAQAKLNQGAAGCQPFPAPIKDSTSRNFSFQNVDQNTFVMQVVTHTTDGGTQTFRWNVNRQSLAFTPVNDLAQVASNHCPALR
jgi:hypothetical protein